jgi:acid phosphatase (class A)
MMRILALLAVALCGCAAHAPPTQVPEYAPGRIHGYLRAEELPDMARILPPPPAEGSAAFAADMEAYRAASRLRDSARWKLAARDADLDFPAADAVFSCALDMPVSEAATPHLHMLLRRTLVDAIDATDAPKKRYRRKRPFMVTGDPTCVPEREAHMKARSYPSGHASVGWAWALALAEIAPDRGDAVLKRGYAFGMSRVVCRAHWKSDVDAARAVGAATVSRLHANPVFVAQMAEARKEVAHARAAGEKSRRDCAAEASALAEGP